MFTQCDRQWMERNWQIKMKKKQTASESDREKKEKVTHAMHRVDAFFH